MADMFSRLPRKDNDTKMETPTKNNATVENFSFILDDKEMLECFLNLPAQDEIPFALDLQQIAQGQNNDPELLQRRMQHPMQYPEQHFGDIRILPFQPTPESRWKIAFLHSNWKM